MKLYSISAGDRDTFGLQCLVRSVSKDWVFGVFRMWCGGVLVGDQDPDTPLQGCRGHAADLEQWLHRHVCATYFSASLEEAGRRLLYHPLRMEDHRFDLSYLGMDSILDDHQSVALVVSPEGGERLLWRRHEELPRDVFMPAGTVLSVTRAWVAAYDAYVQAQLSGPG